MSDTAPVSFCRLPATRVLAEQWQAVLVSLHNIVFLYLDRFYSHNQEQSINRALFTVSLH